MFLQTRRVVSHTHLQQFEKIAYQKFRSKVKNLENDPTANWKNFFRNFFKKINPDMNSSAELWVKRDPNFRHFFYTSDWAQIEPPWTLNVNMKRFLLHQETKTVIFSSNIGLEFMALSKKKYWQMELLRQHFHPFSSFDLYLVLERG